MFEANAACAVVRARLGISRRLAARGGLMAGALLMIAPVGALASAAPRKPTLTLLQQGLAFYRGKTITDISPSAPGGTIDEWTRNLAPYLAAYLHATVNVEDILNASSVPGMDDIAAAPPNGLTLGTANPTTAIVNTFEHLGSIDFNLSRERFIGQVGSGDSVWVASATSPITNFAGLVSHSTAPYAVVSVGNGPVDLNIRAVHVIWDTNGRDLTGYPNTAATIQGFARGDGAVTYQALASVGSLVAAGKARMLMQTIKAPPRLAYAADTAGVPTLAEVGVKDKPHTKHQQALLADLEAFNQVSGLLFMAPAATPPAEVAALRAAADWAFRQPSMKTLAYDQGNLPSWTPGAVAKPVFEKTVVLAQQLVTAIEGS